MTKGEQTRRKIVEAAAPIFNKRGYEGSSLSDLMESTGLKKGGIYRHFSSKEELAAEPSTIRGKPPGTPGCSMWMKRRMA